VPFDASTPGYMELVSLADLLGVSQFMNYAVVIEGEISPALKDIISANDDLWINIGVQGNLPIDRANNVLQNKPFLTYAEAVVHPVEIEESILSHKDVGFYEALVDPMFLIYLLIYVRTGNASRFLMYYTTSEVRNLVEQLEGEFLSQPVTQQNLEIERKPESTGGENPPLESEESTDTKPRKSAKTSKSSDK
jgi:hypothetical protein